VAAASITALGCPSTALAERKRRPARYIAAEAQELHGGRDAERGRLRLERGALRAIA